jgi:hypothetical protein
MFSMIFNAFLGTSHRAQQHQFRDAGAVADSLTGIHIAIILFNLPSPHLSSGQIFPQHPVLIHPQSIFLTVYVSHAYKTTSRIIVLYVLFVSFYSQLSPPVSEPLTNRGVLSSTLLQDILHSSYHLLNVLL